MKNTTNRILLSFQTIFSKYISSNYVYIWVIVLLGLFPIFWYKKGEIIANADLFPIWFNTTNSNNKIFFIWDNIFCGQIGMWPSHLLYQSLWDFFTLIGLDMGFIQIAFFICASMFSGLSIYFLVLNIFKNKTTSFFASLFYMFNFFIIFTKRNPSFDWFYIFQPLLFLEVFNCLHVAKHKPTNYLVRHLIYLIILSTITFSFLSHSLSILLISIMSIIIWTSLLLIYYENNRLTIVKCFFIILSLSFLINLWWIIPLLLQYIFDTSTSWSTWGTSSGINTDLPVHGRASFLNVFKLNSIWSWTNDYYSFIKNYDNSFLIFTVFIPIIFFTIGLFKKNVFITLTSVIVIFFIFMQKGLHTPFDGINLFFYKHFPLSGIFRDPMKFGLITLILFAICFGFSIDFIREKYFQNRNNLSCKLRQIITTLIAIGVILSVWPLINGRLFEKGGKLSPFSSYIKIPKYWYDSNSRISKNRLDYKMITLPDNQFYFTPYTWGLYGYDITNILIPKDILNVDPGYKINTSYNKVIESFYTLIRKPSRINDSIFRYANIRYLINRLDIDRLYTSTNTISENAINIYLKNSVVFEKNTSLGKLTFFKLSDNVFLQHFYTPKNSIFSGNSLDSLASLLNDKDYETRTVVYFKNQNVGKLDAVPDSKIKIENTPVLEFKKINPTKYRVMVHGAKSSFPLVFSESFHDGWKAYIAKSNIKSQISNIPKSLSAGPVLTSKVSTRARQDEPDRNEIMTKYKILDGNIEDQASDGAVLDFIDKGWISTLGDGKDKTIEHKKWTDNKEQLDYVEKYNIDFISKNFQDTIQNDNLSEGNIFETWFARNENKDSIVTSLLQNDNVKQISDDRHLQANGYANSWIVNPEEICGKNAGPVLTSKVSTRARQDEPDRNKNAWCKQNEDGSYDFEMVVEFWPQRLFYIGGAISLSTFIGCIIYLIWDKLKKPSVAHPSLKAMDGKEKVRGLA